MVYGNKQNRKNLGLLDVHTVEKMRERHRSRGPEPVYLVL